MVYLSILEGVPTKTNYVWVENKMVTMAYCVVLYWYIMIIHLIILPNNIEAMES